jgi:hypothetical protein
MAHLSDHMSTLSQNYNDALRNGAHTIAGMTGEPLAQAMQTANGYLYTTFISSRRYSPTPTCSLPRNLLHPVHSDDAAVLADHSFGRRGRTLT